jgi:hypothetical protein
VPASGLFNQIKGISIPRPETILIIEVQELPVLNRAEEAFLLILLF